MMGSTVEAEGGALVDIVKDQLGMADYTQLSLSQEENGISTREDNSPLVTILKNKRGVYAA